MSRYGWERGEIVLPSAAVKTVRDAVWKAHNQIRDRAMELCQVFWKDTVNGTRSLARYDEALSSFHDGENTDRPQLSSLTAPGTSRHRSGIVNPRIEEAARELAADLLWRATSSGYDQPRQPRRVQAKDLDARYPKATSRTTSVAERDFSIGFDGRTLHWRVEENNYAIDRAHDHPVADALFDALAKVQWTRGTGGALWQEDEHSRDAARHDPHANAKSISGSYGPRGEEIEAERMGMPVKRLREMRTQARQSQASWGGYRRGW